MADSGLESSIDLRDGDSFRVQQSTFATLNLVVLAVLLVIHTLFAVHFGAPSATLILILAAAFAVRMAELVWAQSRSRAPGSAGVAALTWVSIILNLGLAFVLATLADRPDNQYFVLLAMPVIEAAFRFRLAATTAVIVIADSLNFLWLAHYEHIHAPVNVSEYFEAGTVSMIYALVGLLVWFLVNDLRQKESTLARNSAELQQTRERLIEEERLAAVGRLSSAIAHEIRNPVAMISSSLATAVHGGCDPQERDEMFAIAAKEAARLEQFTNDFLAYARPRVPEKVSSSIADLLFYVADICRARAREQDVQIEVVAPGDLMSEFDPGHMQQALLNLVLNAVEGAPQHGCVRLSARQTQDQTFIAIENTGEPISDGVVTRLFEPFFTTKPGGTGLGLAIARNIARAHGGELQLSANGPDRICFSLVLPARHESLAQRIGA